MATTKKHPIIATTWTVLVLCLVVLFPSCLLAREPAEPDTSAAESAAMDSIEARFGRSRWTSWLNDFIFVGRSRSDSADVMIVTDVQSEDQYVSYGGRFIRRIDIAQLPVFNTETAVPGGLLGIGDALHVDTRKRIIRKYLLMKEGTPLDPYLLSDTERILRSTPFIEDATIVVIPVAESADSVDLLVVTQDTWSIGLAGSIRGVGKYKVKLFERNFVGLGQLLEAEFDVDDERSQEVNFTGLYRVDNVLGLFTDLDLRYTDSHVERRPQATLSRPFRTAEIRYGGALNLARVEEKDTAAVVVRSYDYQDLWVGRAFRWGDAGPGGSKRAQFTVSGRIGNRNYVRREPVDESSDRALHDGTLFLGSLSLNLAEYRKALLLRSYGTTDDIGTGYLVSATGGYEDGEFDTRWYAGGRLSSGTLGGLLGYHAWLFEAGSFLRRNDFQDGALRLNLSGFSNLSRPGRYRYRLFYGVDYLVGFDRRSASRLRLMVPGVDTDLADIQRVSLGLEGVAFTPWRALGFRFALFGTLNAGTVGPQTDSFIHGKYYSSFGLGLRFHSDRLVFGAYEIRLVYVPRVPPGGSASEFDFATVRAVHGGDFTPQPPAPVGYE
jgi:hypothetical protein